MNLLWKSRTLLVIVFWAVTIPVAFGQGLSLTEANAACSGRSDNALTPTRNTKSYTDVMLARQKRAINQSKITIGMTRDQVIELLGRPDDSGAAWLDSAETTCHWAYYSVPELTGGSPPTFRNLEIVMNLNQRVVGMYFQEPIFGRVDSFTGKDH